MTSLKRRNSLPSSDESDSGKPSDVDTMSKESYSSGVASRQKLLMDLDQVVYKTSSLALLRSKNKLAKRILPNETVRAATDVTDASKGLYSFMYDIWKSGKFCDLVLHHKTGDIPAHKLVVAFHSDAMAEKLMSFPADETVSLDVSEFKKDVVDTVVRFLYTHELNLTDVNVGRVLKCAKELHIDSIIVLCEEYLSKYDIDTALRYHAIATTAGSQPLEDEIGMFISNNISKIVKTKAFRKLGFERVFHLFSDEKMQFKSEIEIFLAIVRWVNHDRDERMSLAHILLKTVRFHLITPEELVTRVEAVTWLFKPRACYTVLCEAYKYHALKAAKSDLVSRCSLQESEHSSPQQTYRSSLHYVLDNSMRRGSSKTPETLQGVQAHTFLVVSGGLNLESPDRDVPGRSVLVYDEGENTWRDFTQLPINVHHHGSAVIGGNLIVIGGAHYDVNNPKALGAATNKVHLYNFVTGTWTSSEMSEKRAFHSVVQWGPKVIVIGGENEEGVLDSVEWFDPETNAWTFLANIPGGGRIGCACAVYGDLLFVAGGYNCDATPCPVLDTLDCFDLQQKRWLMRKPLPFPLCHASMVVVLGRLFLIGGRTQCEDDESTITSLACVMEYDVINDAWFQVAFLETPRHDASAAAVGSRLYVIGGMNSQSATCVSSVECVDVASSEPVSHVQHLPLPATGLSTCLLDTTAIHI